jgi:hypothetical protein
VAPNRPGSAVNLAAIPLLPARHRRPGSSHPCPIHVRASTPPTRWPPVVR